MNRPIRIVSTGRYLPEKVLSNADLEKIVDTTSEWIETRSGIRNRRMAEGEDTSDMAAKAALAAFAKVNYDPRKIDLIVTATISPDQKTPSASNFIQSKIGLKDKTLTAFDINAACTGFIYALEVATSLLSSGNYHSALVIGAEHLTKLVDYTDRNTCVLFGDGAGAVILETSEDSLDQPYFFTASRFDEDQVLTVIDHIHMDGKRVYAFAVKVLEEGITRVLAMAGLCHEDIDVIIPHQANIRIIQYVSKTMDIPLDKFFMNIRDYGNTSSASIAIALDEYMETHPDSHGKKALFVGFGGGFTWGSALITL